MMTKICPRCGEPYAWLERRRHGNHVYLYAVHERTENGARRRRRCYLGPEEEAGQKPKEARASPRLEAEERPRRMEHLYGGNINPGISSARRVPQRGARSARGLRRAVVQ